VLFLSQLAFLRAAGVKIVWTVHDLRSQGQKNPRLERIGTMLTGRIAHAMIAHCEKARAEVLKQPLLGQKDKVFVVPHGHYIGYYDNEISRAQARLALGLPQESFTFLLFGWIEPYKGIAELIDAFEHIRLDEAYLLIAGNSARTEFADLIHKRVAPQARIKLIHGFIPEDEVQIYMNACDVVVLPYRDVLTSGAVILAMSFGRPCVAIRRGCISDVLDESGAFFYEPNSEEGLLRAMECAMQKRSELADMGRYNQERANQWGWDRVAQKTTAIYRWVVKGGPRPDSHAS
jgi:glycosyltransferase involved in cell wall biosynthesis